MHVVGERGVEIFGEGGVPPSKEVSVSGGSMVTWIQPVEVTLVVRFVADILFPSEKLRAAMWNCFS